MTDLDPDTTFRKLPLTPEQDAEVRHYIKSQTQRGQPWDTSELSAMLKDMLQPPGDENDEFDESDEFDASADEKGAAERAMGSVEDEMDATEASEEWNAAMESEIMKGPKR
ncbi:hypothetical protein [Burkholderia sp. S171]|uniref:hypothetical protein n=1 Tax=Burkholderia sp. S171 TaxID=1641860 RepID=UPI00131BF377|nr:hypothetical protein [Burkholderia sp. S171]